MEAIGIAVQVYLLGFVISFAMACIIKFIMFMFNRGSRKRVSRIEADSAVKLSGKEGQV